MSAIAKWWISAGWIAIALCLSFPLSAEMGKGTVEDPLTRQYTDGVYKDWIEGVTLHSGTGNYLVVYKDDYGFFNQVVFEPATKVEPSLKSRFRADDRKQAIVYEYKLKNGKDSRQKISDMRVYISNINPGYPVGPSDWRSSVNPILDQAGLLVSWSTVMPGVSSSGLAPGKSAQGFRLESNDLPGIAVMRIEGDASQTAWLGHIPEIDTPVGAQVNQLRVNNFMPRRTVAPKIPVGSPYNGATTLDALRTHTTKDIIELKLIEPTLANQLDRSLQAAADTIRRNTPKAAREHLHEVMKLLKKDHPDCDKEDADDKDDDDEKNAKGNTGSIDRLVARVIAFDIKYVEKRLKEK